MMEFEDARSSGIVLTARHRRDFEEFRSFVDAEVRSVAAQQDREQKLDSNLLSAVVKGRYLASFLPAEHGGRECDWISYGLLHEAMGAACTSTRSLLTVHDMVTHTVWRWGQERHRSRWLPGLASGRLIGAFALSEPHGGSNAGDLQTSAEPVAGGYLLNGTKRWISFGQIADVFLVFARRDRGTSAFLVPRDAPGLTITPIRDLLGARASMLAELNFDGCVVKDEPIGPARRAVPQVTTSALTIGRLGVASGSLGMVQECLDVAHSFSRERGGSDSPLIDRQLVQRMLAQMVTDIEAGRLLWLNAAALLDAREPRASMATMVAKHFAALAAARCTHDAVQLLGAVGCTPRYPVERMFRDAKIMEVIEGSNEMQQITIGRYGYTEAGGMLPMTGGIGS